MCVWGGGGGGGVSGGSHSLEGRQFMIFLFAFLHTSSKGSKFFPFRADPFSDRLASLENECIPLN